MPITLTNKSGVPELFVRACQVDRHVTKGDISVTQLIDAPQVRYLKATNDIEVDVEDMIWMLFGTSVHHIIERAEVSNSGARQLLDAVAVLERMEDEKISKAANYLRTLARSKFPEAFDNDNLLEHTLSIIIDSPSGSMELSGTMDKFEITPGLLRDYKVTSVYGYIYQESKKKYYTQQNVYAHMLRQHGYTVNKSVITALFKDWKGAERLRNKDYPPSLAMDIEVPLHPDNVVADYLKKRVDMHIRASNGEHIPCTKKDMWATADAFAVKKPGRKAALRVLPTVDQANQWISDKELTHKDMFIDMRPGERKRCEKYCNVSSVCPQFNKYKEELNKK